MSNRRYLVAGGDNPLYFDKVVDLVQSLAPENARVDQLLGLLEDLEVGDYSKFPNVGLVIRIKDL